MKNKFGTLLATLVISTAPLANTAAAKDWRVVTWNMQANLIEELEDRWLSLRKFDKEYKPDILVVVETAGISHVQQLARSLGWKEYYGIGSRFSKSKNNPFHALEVAVISKSPIQRVIEYDVRPDNGKKKQVHQVFTHKEDAISAIPVEQKILAAPAIFAPMKFTDRGTLRVDLANHLTIFPVHLKSNGNSACAAVSDAIKSLQKVYLSPPQALYERLRNGFPQATKVHHDNARARERVIAAVAVAAQEAIAEGRKVIISGDFNTAYEPGKYGQSLKDCKLTEHTCEKTSFPQSACVGDGFDDTLSILEKSLVSGTEPWTILTKGLGRTYKESGRDPKFANLAIDHIAVPKSQAKQFSKATKGDKLFRSDHYPVITVYSDDR